MWYVIIYLKMVYLGPLSLFLWYLARCYVNRRASFCQVSAKKNRRNNVHYNLVRFNRCVAAATDPIFQSAAAAENFGRLFCILWLTV